MIRERIKLSACQARGLAFIMLAAVLVVCASLAVAFLMRAKHAAAEEVEDGAVYHTWHTDGDEEEQEENFFNVHAEYADEIEAELPTDFEEDELEHDETECWHLCKTDTSSSALAYKLCACGAVCGAVAKEDGVKRRQSSGSLCIQTQACRS